MKTKYLIIGNSAGGIGAAEAIREIDREGTMTIVSEEPYPAYSRPLIAKYLANHRSLESILYRPADFYTRNKINTRLGVGVSRLSLPGKKAELENGESINWEELLLATGGTPITPRIRGSRRRGIGQFITLNDVRYLEQQIVDARHAVVIGGGLIGISATEALTKRGLKVTVVEMKDRILNVMLDEAAASLVQTTLKNAGVEIIVNRTVVKVTGRPDDDERVGGVVLDKGEQIPCDVVVIAIGVAPRLDLVKGSRVGINRGILVDRFMATNIPHVYACGDVAESYDFVYGYNRVVPIWPTAYIGGRVAGSNMAGYRLEFGGATAMNALNYFGLPIISAGMVTVPADQGYEMLVRETSGSYRKVVVKDNRLVGIVFIGNIDRAGILFGLMKDNIDIASFKSELTADGFSLSSLPLPLREERKSLSGWNLFSPAAV